MSRDNDALLISPQPQHLKRHLRKASWLINQVRLQVERSPELDPSGYFARNLTDVERHLVATVQAFCKPKDTPIGKDNHHERNATV